MTATDILDGLTGQRVEDVRFEVLDADANYVDVCHPVAETGSVTWDPSNRISRKLSGVQFDPDEAATLTAGVNRIRPVWLVGGSEYPLGVFRYLGGARSEHAGEWFTDAAPMQDRGYQLKNLIRSSYNVPAVAVLTDVFADVAAGAGITDLDVTASGVVNGLVPLNWFGGETTRINILDRLTDLLGYLPSYFDNTGCLVARPVPVPTDDAPDHVYADGDNARVVSESETEVLAVTDRPNIYIARSTTPSGSPVVGIYEVPETYENSYARTGDEVPFFIDMDGLATTAQATEVARRRAQRDMAVVRTVTFDTVPDPRHDSWGVVEWNGERMLETGWTLELKAGGKHSHVLTNVFAGG